MGFDSNALSKSPVPCYTRRPSSTYALDQSLLVACHLPLLSFQDPHARAYCFEALVLALRFNAVVDHGAVST